MTTILYLYLYSYTGSPLRELLYLTYTLIQGVLPPGHCGCPHQDTRLATLNWKSQIAGWHLL